LVPKLAPRSPRPAADSSASQAACAAASPSEWPARPGSPGQCRPARYSGVPALNGCTSVPMPIRGIRSAMNSPENVDRGRVARFASCWCAPQVAPPCAAGSPGSGAEDFVEQRFSLVLVCLLGQGQFTDQDLPGLGQHPLFPGRKAAFLISPP